VSKRYERLMLGRHHRFGDVERDMPLFRRRAGGGSFSWVRGDLGIFVEADHRADTGCLLVDTVNFRLGGPRLNAGGFGGENRRACHAGGEVEHTLTWGDDRVAERRSTATTAQQNEDGGGCRAFPAASEAGEARGYRYGRGECQVGCSLRGCGK
jgi:hypothetical protein